MPISTLTRADLIDRPARGVSADTPAPTLSSERREHLLREAMRLKIPLPLLIHPGDEQGQATLVYGREDEIIMDARMPIAVLRDVPDDERVGDWVMQTDDRAWTALRFTVSGDTPTPGCGVGYFGLGWSVDELTRHLLGRLSDLDFVCLAAQVSLNTLTQEPRVPRHPLGPLHAPL